MNKLVIVGFALFALFALFSSDVSASHMHSSYRYQPYRYSYSPDYSPYNMYARYSYYPSPYFHHYNNVQWLNYNRNLWYGL